MWRYQLNWNCDLIMKLTTYSSRRGAMIKSVLQSIPLYAMSTFRVPSKVSEALDSRIRNFWWGQKTEPGYYCIQKLGFTNHYANLIKLYGGIRRSWYCWIIFLYSILCFINCNIPHVWIFFFFYFNHLKNKEKITHKKLRLIEYKMGQRIYTQIQN